jgi:alpha-mannosidase
MIPSRLGRTALSLRIGKVIRLKAVTLALALTTCLVSPAAPADKTVWKVGVFDGSSGEFASGVPHGAVHFVVGQDQPRTAWYAFAPAAWAGKPPDPTSAPRAIDFSIAGRPERAYRLKASLLIEHSSVPVLRVTINGRFGTFYLHPSLDYNMGDMVAAFYPAYARAEVEVDFPGLWLKAGLNSITFQAVSADDKVIPDAGFEYDAIELQQADPVPTAISAHAEPTIFFQKHGASIVLGARIRVYGGYRRTCGGILNSGRSASKYRLDCRPYSDSFLQRSKHIDWEW